MAPMGDTRGRRHAQTIAVGLALALLCVAAASGQANADAVDETGYWWRLQPVEGSPAAPPGVQPGQLYVAADAAGFSAIAAVRAEVGAARVVALELTQAASTGTPILRACPTSGWSKTDGAGPLRDAPPLDRCPGESVPGSKSGTVWTFPVEDLVDDGVLDVAIVTGLEDQSVTFEAPGVDALRIAPPAVIGDDRVVDDEGAAVSAAPPPAAPPFPAPEGGGHDFALDALAQIPSSGLAPDVPSVPAAAFDDDVVGLPAPTRRQAPLPPGERSPLALVAAALVIATWAWRANAALGSAASHPLFGPLRLNDGALVGAGQVLAVADQADTGSTPSTGRRRQT